MNQLYQFAATYAMRKPVALNVRMSRHKPRDVIELSDLCLKHNSLDLYLWLSFRFPEFFVEQELCLEQKAFAIMAIEDSLDAHSLQQRFSHSQEYQTVRNSVLNGDALGLPPASYGAVRDTYAKNIQSISPIDLYTFPRMSEEEITPDGGKFDRNSPLTKFGRSGSRHVSNSTRPVEIRQRPPPSMMNQRPWMASPQSTAAPSAAPSVAPISMTPVNRSVAPDHKVKYQLVFDIATQSFKKTVNTKAETGNTTKTTKTGDLRAWQQPANMSGNNSSYTNSGGKLYRRSNINVSKCNSSDGDKKHNTSNSSSSLNALNKNDSNSSVNALNKNDSNCIVNPLNKNDSNSSSRGIIRGTIDNNISNSNNYRKDRPNTKYGTDINKQDNNNSSSSNRAKQHVNNSSKLKSHLSQSQDQRQNQSQVIVDVVLATAI